MEQAVSGYYVLDVIGKQLTQFLSKAQSSGYSTRRSGFCAASCCKKVEEVLEHKPEASCVDLLVN